MISDVIVLLLGLGCAGAGGEAFVRGAVGIAAWARVPAGIIGATVVAFATSSPELAVAAAAGNAGTPTLALGDALGSNVVNLGLVLGVVLLLGTVVSARPVGLRRDILFALALPAILAVLLLDGSLSRPDGAVLLLVFFLWLALTALEARRERSAAVAVTGGEVDQRHIRLLATAATGVGLLILAGRLIVSSAKPIGIDLGLDPFVVGVVIVAIGTSIPELATSVIARLRGHAEIGLGNVLGSNIFNGGLIIGLVALLFPTAVDANEIAITLSLGFVMIALLAAVGQTRLNSITGSLLLTGYVASVLALLATAHR